MKIFESYWEESNAFLYGHENYSAFSCIIVENRRSELIHAAAYKVSKLYEILMGLLCPFY